MTLKGRHRKMNQIKNIPGYELVRTKEIPDVQGTGYVFKHIKSGARVLVLKSDDENKVFSIGFKTPPKDSTGVAHITEHTVLCGSKKFPLKDPFVELCKGSLNTFLNAMTYPDKTIYPVASCNDKDFRNLEDVYMDAVFHPNLHVRDEIFKQEGWRYELENADDDITLNGVVYSEMKGVYSSPDSLFSRYGMDLLFPDTEYGVDSGGNPDVIPELTIENYRNFHKTFYHPSNSYIWLYGDVDIEEQLTWMDKEYLSEFDKITVDSSIKVQKPFGCIKDVTKYYSVDEEKTDGKGCFYSMSVLAGENSDLMKGLGLELINYCLFNAPGAPVKQALIDAGIGDDVFAYYDGECLQPYFVIGVKNAMPGLKDKFVSVINDSLKKCVDGGLNEKTLNAAINILEFKYREADFGSTPKGLIYGISSYSTWLYDDDKPFDMLETASMYKEVRKKIGTSWFADLINEYFLNSKHGVVLSLLPKVGLNKEKNEDLKNRLKALKASMTKEEINKLVEDTKALKAYQEMPETDEDLRKIPLLSIDDIRKNVSEFKNEPVFPEIGKNIWHNYKTNGIAYMRFNFNLKCLSAEEVPYAGILTWFLGYTDTKKHGYQELSDIVNEYTGGIEYDTTYHISAKDYNSYVPFFKVAGRCLYEMCDKTTDIIKEVLSETILSDKKRAREIMFEGITSLETSNMNNGTGVARKRVASYTAEPYAYADASSGRGMHMAVKKITDNFDKNADAFIEKLEAVSKKIFTKENLVVSIVCDEEGLKYVKPCIKKIYDMLPSVKQPEILKFNPVRKNEGLKTSGQVNFVARGGNVRALGYEITGPLEVLTSMLTYGYLWNEVRVKGGAYGTAFRVAQGGSVDFTSFRDPNLKRTNEVFENVVNYIENYEADDREMTKAIIGFFGNVDAPRSPRSNGDRSFGHYMSEETYEECQKIRDGARTCTPADIRALAPVLKDVLGQNFFAVVGPTESIEENKDLFMNIENLN